jgi:hypothetical protein
VEQEVVRAGAGHWEGAQLNLVAVWTRRAMIIATEVLDVPLVGSPNQVGCPKKVLAFDFTWGLCSWFVPNQGRPKMAQDPQVRPSTGMNVAEFRQLLGPPPVLRAECAQSYDEIIGRLMECLAPRDFMEQMLIREFADCTWEMARYTRHKTLALERGFSEYLEFPGQDALAERLAEHNREPDNVRDGLIDEDEAIAVELDTAHALQRSLGYHERLDKLLITATARRNNVLEQIERYRDGLGHPLRQVSDQIIEAESNGVEGQPKQLGAPLVPSDAQQQ